MSILAEAGIIFSVGYSPALGSSSLAAIFRAKIKITKKFNKSGSRARKI
jgi:hypothetical protein